MDFGTIAMDVPVGQETPDIQMFSANGAPSNSLYPDLAIDAAIEKAFSELERPQYVKLETPESLSPEETDWTAPEFANDGHGSLESSPEDPQGIQNGIHEQTQDHQNLNIDTVAALKREMANHSRMVGTYTTMKSAYLKLCKEFNYLLGLFNDNEKAKIGLIHENNQLRQMLVEVIKQREIDRQRYREVSMEG
ncbi:uncharacterized protein CXQ87_002322 [Candidozyma duobushaemuli]|uniref:Uncharacterized protein n=1 Tax=Candidozyma duobushaemuli TaxID=1231522 RepID=A0A2V1A944_9ASCO|nr:uncharacterized protein CXQ87_002322 [[Candida] duobushaemulonis]PVH14195.1 hypothetical protein CXQ87_002322 [[Candida] duobushaemulonis]